MIAVKKSKTYNLQMTEMHKRGRCITSNTSKIAHEVMINFRMQLQYNHITNGQVTTFTIPRLKHQALLLATQQGKLLWRV